MWKMKNMSPGGKSMSQGRKTCPKREKHVPRETNMSQERKICPNGEKHVPREKDMSQERNICPKREKGENLSGLTEFVCLLANETYKNRVLLREKPRNLWKAY